MQDIRKHPWFKGIDFKNLGAKKPRPPSVPLLPPEHPTSTFEDYSSFPPMQ